MFDFAEQKSFFLIILMVGAYSPGHNRDLRFNPGSSPDRFSFLTPRENGDGTSVRIVLL